jgi:hypothetical protein
MQRPRRAFPSAFASALLSCATLLGLFGGSLRERAHAYEEQLSVDVAVGYARVTHSDTLSSRPAPPSSTLPANLPAIDLGVSLGISDWLVLRGALGYGLLLDKQKQTYHLGRARVELAYLIDIVQWVPFVGLGAGLWLIDTRSELAPRGAGHLVFGLDYLATRSWTLGVDVRTGFLFGGGQVVNFTEGQLRLSRMFELF